MMPGKSLDGKPMREGQSLSVKLNSVVSTEREFDELVTKSLPELLDRATSQTKRFLRETGQWVDDITHEKMALRWGYELVERFVVFGRTEVPCRPFFLLDSLIAKSFSQPDPLCYHKELLSPVGRFLDGLASRAVVSRDALIALFYHFYGLGQAHVVKLLGLGQAESQRVYKNFERWRQTGWQRTMDESGLSGSDLELLDEELRVRPDHLQHEVNRLIPVLQAHYRKSEPENYPCLPAQKWGQLFEDDYGHDYRVWHLAFCRDCFLEVADRRQTEWHGGAKPQISLHIHPLKKGGILALFGGDRGGRSHGSSRAQRLSRTPA
jgi:hypothetical protein